MFCRSCGAKLPEGAVFCSSCGTPVAGAATTAPGSRSEGDAGLQPTVVRPPAAAEPPPVAPEQPTVVRPSAADAPTVILPPVVARPQAPPPQAPPPQVVPPQVVPPQAPRLQTPPPSVTYSQGPAGPAAPSGPAGYTPGGYTPSGYSAGPYGTPPPQKSRSTLWIALALTAVIIIGAAVAVWLLVLDKDDDVVETTSTTKVAGSSTTTTVASTTTSSASGTTSTAPSTTVTMPLGAPGDSAGRWAEMDIPSLPADAYAVAVSDQALLIDAQVGPDEYKLHAYMLDSQELIELPVEGPDFYGEDIDGLLAVWWEGAYDEETGAYRDEHIYAYPLPDGPKVEIAGNRSVYYPQVAGGWITWVEEEPWEQNPEEYWFSQIYGVQVDSAGNPQSEPILLVPAATGYAQGDTSWTYSLSNTHLTWENATAVETFDPGIYAMDLESRQPLILGSEIWRPSAATGRVVYTDVGLKAADMTDGGVTTIDASGDFATAAPTYAVYFRSSEADGLTVYDIVARGYAGAYEQKLGTQDDPPWFSPFIAASANHVAFIVGGTVHVFVWQGPDTL